MTILDALEADVKLHDYETFTMWRDHAADLIAVARAAEANHYVGTCPICRALAPLLEEAE